MKKVILGSTLILAGSMSNEWTVNGEFSSLWNISQYGLMPAIYIFTGIAIVGLVLAVWGLFDRKD